MSKTGTLWFVTGSQHLYGPETLEQVAANAKEIAAAFHADSAIPVEVVWKPTVTTPDEVYAICRDVNADENCVGLITWMHTHDHAAAKARQRIGRTRTRLVATVVIAIALS